MPLPEKAPSEGHFDLAHNGHRVYWSTDKHGARVYVTDEIGGGVEYMNTMLHDAVTMNAIAAHELQLQGLERLIAEERLRKM